MIDTTIDALWQYNRETIADAVPPSYRRRRIGQPGRHRDLDMTAHITFDPVRIETGSADSEGRLAYRDGRLIGVLTRLDPELHEELGVGRHWYLEAGFGPVASANRPLPFPTLDEAKAWLAGCVGTRPPCLRDLQPPRPPRDAWARPTCREQWEGGRPGEA